MGSGRRREPVVQQPRELGGIGVGRGGDGEVRDCGASVAEVWNRNQLAHSSRNTARPGSTSARTVPLGLPATQCVHQQGEVAATSAAAEQLAGRRGAAQHLAGDQPHGALHAGEPVDVGCGEFAQAALQVAASASSSGISCSRKPGERIADQRFVKGRLLR
jgi:hypothetical protein